MAWGFLHRTPAASTCAHECSRFVVAPFLVKMQPLPDAGLGHAEPRLKVIHSGSEDLETASFTLALASLLDVAEDDGLFLRDEVVDGLSFRDNSARVLTVCCVWAQCSGDSEHRWACIRHTSVVSSMMDLIGNNWTTLRFTAPIKSVTARKAG